MPFSFFAIPWATPMANSSGMLLNTMLVMVCKLDKTSLRISFPKNGNFSIM